MRRAAIASILALCTGCTSPLPEPESAGARLYAEHCNGCHRVFAPSSLTSAMWKVQVERMQGEMARRGVPPLTREEMDVVLAYLYRHSADPKGTP